eukprot:scaffold916_cov516-Prasinococcus_capsulatus_cf.AAC.36
MVEENDDAHLLSAAWIPSDRPPETCLLCSNGGHPPRAVTLATSAACPKDTPHGLRTGRSYVQSMALDVPASDTAEQRRYAHY